MRISDWSSDVCSSDLLGSQDRIAQAYQTARAAQAGAITWDPEFAWRMADNSYLPLPLATDMVALALAAQAEVHRRLKVSWGHKDAIDALENVAEVEARSEASRVGKV